MSGNLTISTFDFFQSFLNFQFTKKNTGFFENPKNLSENPKNFSDLKGGFRPITLEKMTSS